MVTWLNAVLSKIFGYQVISESDYNKARNHLKVVAEAESKNIKLIAEIKRYGQTLQQERELYDRLVGEKKKHDPIDVNMGDPAPEDQKQRRVYVNEVAGFHRTHLREKMLQMISSSYSLLEASSNDRDLDLTLKGTIYAFRELIRWGDRMVSEDISNSTETNE